MGREDLKEFYVGEAKFEISIKHPDGDARDNWI